MKQSFIDSQIELGLKYVEKMRAIKQATALLRTNPTSSELLSMRSELQIEAAETFATMGSNIMRGNENNASVIDNMGIAENYFENN